MENAQLIAHVDSSIVTYEQLKQYAPPVGTKTWRPVSHIQLVDTLLEKITAKGLQVKQAEYAVSNNGLKLFGVMDLQNELVPGIGRALGFRQGLNRDISIQVVSGGRVTVCDNMMLSGQITVIKQKHVWGFDLGNAIAEGLERSDVSSAKFAKGILEASETAITDDRARAAFAKLLYDGVITQQVFRAAYDLFFEKAVRQPEFFEDCAPRTVLGLHNAFTRAFKLSSANVRFNQTIELSKVLGIWKNVERAVFVPAQLEDNREVVETEADLHSTVEAVSGLELPEAPVVEAEVAEETPKAVNE